MKVVRCFGRTCMLLALMAHAQTGSEPYRNASLAIDARVGDLVGRMNLDEKLGQLLTVTGWPMYTKEGARVGPSNAFGLAVKERQIGGLWGLMRADPWTKVTLRTGLSPRESAEAVNALQRYAIGNSRWGIPLLLAEECAHGHMAIGSTVFPTSIGQASTWDPALIQKRAHAVAAETRASGANVCYAPILDIAREPRWSRVEESYGEDPVLVSQMGQAVVRGLQGASLASPDAVLSTLKHFAGYGQPEGGHNGGPAHAGPRELRSILLPAFQSAVQAGAGSVMTSYNDIDGVPSVANSWLLTGVLRREWGFSGFVVSDLSSIEGLVGSHIAADKADAAAQAIRAGVDSDLGGAAFVELARAVEDHRVPMEVIDRAVSAVLRAKFQLGLFDKPYADPDRAAATIGKAEHWQLARQIARESITLLRNENSLLPLAKTLPSIAVVGPNADSVYNQLGDYTAPQPAGKVVTVLDAIHRAVSPKTVVRYAKGCTIRGASTAGFDEALDAVRQSDVAVVVMGGSSARDFNTLFEGTGAAAPSLDSNGSDMDSGEGLDRASLDLAGVQLDLLKQIVAVGKPVVLVLIEGRPLNLNWPAEHVPAILDAWYPGEQGGFGIADVLFGDYNPVGRLPISVPKSVGQAPVFYNSDGRVRGRYVEQDGAPLFAFGFGLSYTQFRYSNLQVSVEGKPEDLAVHVAVDVANTGSRAGDEVVQLYLRDLVSSVTTPIRALKAFSRVHLGVGEKRTVRFELKSADLALVNRQMQWVVEPGAFDAQVGASSSDIRLRGQFVVR